MKEEWEWTFSDLVELWEDYGTIGDEFLDIAHEVERDREVHDETKQKIVQLIAKNLDIAVRLHKLLYGEEP